MESASYFRTSDHSILWKINDASPNAISAIHHVDIPKIGECIITGDDEGVIRIWDVKACVASFSNATDKKAFDNCMALPPGCIASFYENNDYISSFQVDDDCKTLLAASADGILTIINLTKGGKTTKEVKKESLVKIDPVKIDPKTVQGPFRVHRKSDDQEDELLSMCLMKHGKKVVVGTQLGVLNFWSWGTWGDISDRFPGHPQSIDALLKVDEDTLLTGSSDGVLRVVQIQPDQLLGVLGDHDGFPVEKLKFSNGNKLIGSISHDFNIRLWDASIFGDDDCDDEDEDDEHMKNMDSEAIASNVALAAARGTNGDSEDEWEDADSDDSMDDSDDDTGSGKGNKNRKFKTETEEFFSDL